MKNFDAIIFDLDGVIIDSEPLHEQVFHEIWREMGHGDDHGIDFANYYGKSDLTVWIDFIAKHKPIQSIEKLSEWKQAKYLEVIRRTEPIFEPVPALVESLRKRYKLAVASGSVKVVIGEVLKLKGLDRFFQSITSAEEVAHPKPAPDVFLEAARRIGVAPERCCVIEDTVFGVAAAKAAGMTCIAITNTFPREKLTEADQVADDYEQIGEYLGSGLQ